MRSEHSPEDPVCSGDPGVTHEQSPVRTFRVLVIDDDTSESLKTSIDKLFARVGELTNRKVCLDWVTSWVSTDQSDSGLARLLSEPYDLVVLDMAFPGKEHQGYEIHESIRTGKAGQSARMVPIMVCTRGEGEAQLITTQVTMSPNFFRTFILFKSQIPTLADDFIEGLVDWCLAHGQVMHVRIPSAQDRASALSEMQIGFAVSGNPPSRWKRPGRQAPRIIAELFHPSVPAGKEDWACEVIGALSPARAMSLTSIRKAFEELTGQPGLLHRHPNGRKGWQLLDGVSEVVLEFQDPKLFGLDAPQLVLSTSPGKPRFVPEDLWPDGYVERS